MVNDQKPPIQIEPACFRFQCESGHCHEAVEYCEKAFHVADFVGFAIVFLVFHSTDLH